MKELLLIIALLIYSIATAQVGINTTNPQSALDITAVNTTAPSNTDGILIPRINNFPTTNPTVHQQSMLVYLTTNRNNLNISGAAQDYPSGFYYWDNTVPNWIPVLSNTDWKITGNDNTTSGTHFIGTTNPEEVDFRVNRKLVSRLTELGQFELEADEKSIFIGFEAGEAYDPDNTSSEHNTFLGYQAGKETNSGRDNTAMGTLSLSENTSGDFNTGVGDETLENNTTGDRNTAVGNDALRQNEEGDDNTAIGQTALINNNSGDDNTAIGINAGATNQTGDSNVFIGADADTSGTAYSNAIAIGNGATTGSNNAIAIGDNTDATAPESIAIGDNTDVLGGSDSAIAIGEDSSVNDDSNESVVLGIGSTINNGSQSSIALGNNINLEDSNNAIALGNNITIDNGYNNAVGIGNGATPTKANQLKYGNITEIDQGTAAIVNTSDGRFKYDIKTNVPGLDFINRLRPVTYKFDLAKLDAFHNAKTIRENPTKIETGFIAQDIEDAMLASNYDFSGLVKPEDLTKDNYKVSYVTFVVPLVQAVQEQQEVIETQNKKIELLESRLLKLESLIEGLK